MQECESNLENKEYDMPVMPIIIRTKVNCVYFIEFTYKFNLFDSAHCTLYLNIQHIIQHTISINRCQVLYFESAKCAHVVLILQIKTSIEWNMEATTKSNTKID